MRRRRRSQGAAPLRLGAAHARAILDASLDAVITIDHGGHVLEFNAAAERMFGYPKEAALGAELAELIIAPGLRDAHRRALDRWTDSGPTPGAGALLDRRIEVPAMRSDGSLFAAELAISRVGTAVPPLFTACLRDVSERKSVEEKLRAAEFRYRTLVEQLPLISYVDDPGDPFASPLYLSPQIEDVLGWTPEEWLTMPGLFLRSIHEEDRARVLDEKHEAYEHRRPLRSEYRMFARDGRTVWVEDQSVHVEAPDGGEEVRQGFAIDITERKRAEDGLRLAEIRYRTLVEQLPLAVYIDRVDAESSNIYTSPQIETMLGYSTTEWETDPSLFVAVLHPEDRERVLAAHARTHATHDPLRLEYRLHARDGRVVWVHDDARIIEDPQTGALVLQGYLLDVTARKEAEEQLRHQAFHDSLTGLANRALFTDRVEHALVVRSPEDGDLAVLFLDLDDFKAVNDSLGHLAGDALLRDVGERLRATLSPSHTVARTGGDEFAILVEASEGAVAALAAAELVKQALRAPFTVERREVFVTASVGIAVGHDADELLRRSDVAMYRAKALGKAQHVVYTPKMDDRLVGRLELASDLQRVQPEEFVLHYQPTMDLANGAVLGVEALVRWQHPTRGLLQPSEFISLAEETGRIVEIGRWVLDEACRQTADWRHDLPGAEHLWVSVNVSTRQVRHPGLLEDVESALRDSGLAPANLMLEITESVLARRREEMASIFAQVTRCGVRLALDDFGTGYSSLSLLQDLPVHTLKIDRSFVQSIGSEGGRAAFVRAIVDLAHALELTVVAEGVSETAHIAALRMVGCRAGQGFHFAPPLPPDELERFIRAARDRSAA